MSSVPSRTSGAPSDAPAIPPPGGRLRRLLLGPPLPSQVEQQERLSVEDSRHGRHPHLAGGGQGADVVEAGVDPVQDAELLERGHPLLLVEGRPEQPVQARHELCQLLRHVRGRRRCHAHVFPRVCPPRHPGIV
ncbi:MAG: hypothetical protein E6G66_19445 [Actinobacteria bacterium]|nr:MAG: hypothetical protein E6G66_19445 [Actinomycetota bacterium]